MPIIVRENGQVYGADEAEIAAMKKAVSEYSEELNRLDSQSTVVAVDHCVKLDQEIAEIQAACDNVMEQLDESRTSREQRAAEGLRLLVEDIGKQLEDCACKLGIRK